MSNTKFKEGEEVIACANLQCPGKPSVPIGRQGKIHRQPGEDTRHLYIVQFGAYRYFARANDLRSVDQAAPTPAPAADFQPGDIVRVIRRISLSGRTLIEQDALAEVRGRAVDQRTMVGANLISLQVGINEVVVEARDLALVHRPNQKLPVEIVEVTDPQAIKRLVGEVIDQVTIGEGACSIRFRSGAVVEIEVSDGLNHQYPDLLMYLQEEVVTHKIERIKTTIYHADERPVSTET